MAKEITEKDGHQKEWMKRAEKMTLADLPEFLRELTEDYTHDYGTICHAIAAAAVAAAWAVERSPQGGITGFQAGAVTWEMLRGWNSMMIGEIGARIQKMDDLLYPQYADKFTTISADTWAAVQAEAKKRIGENHEMAAAGVIAHWQSIADGVVPFGLRIAA